MQEKLAKAVCSARVMELLNARAKGDRETEHKLWRELTDEEYLVTRWHLAVDAMRDAANLLRDAFVRIYDIGSAIHAEGIDTLGMMRECERLSNEIDALRAKLFHPLSEALRR